MQGYRTPYKAPRARTGRPTPGSFHVRPRSCSERARFERRVGARFNVVLIDCEGCIANALSGGLLDQLVSMLLR